MTTPAQALGFYCGRIAGIYRSHRGIRARGAFTLFFLGGTVLFLTLSVSLLWELHVVNISEFGYPAFGLMFIVGPSALLAGFLLAPRSILDCCEKLFRR